MDETKPVENTVVEQPQVSQKPASDSKNLIMAVTALIVGAALIAAIFLIAFPNETKTVSETATTETKQVTNITKTSDLDTASQELNSTNLDQYQTDLNQIPTSF